MDAHEKYERAMDAWLESVIRAWPEEAEDEDVLLDATTDAWNELNEAEMDRLNNAESGHPLASEYRHLCVEVRSAVDRRRQTPSCHVLRALLMRMRAIWEEASESERVLLKPRSSTWPWQRALEDMEARLAKDINACLPLTRPSHVG